MMEFIRPFRHGTELNRVEQWKAARHPFAVHQAVIDRYAPAGAGAPAAIAAVDCKAERLKCVQDGGLVSALLIAGLEAGAIEGALVVRPSPDEPWKGVPFIASTRQQVLDCGGSFYNQTMALAHLDLRAYQLPPSPRLALVGTPCEIQGLAALQARPWWRGSSQVDAVVLTIALLCTKSFDYQGLMLRELRDERGLDLGAVGRAADVSVGSVGSPDGWSSVLVRSQAGATPLTSPPIGSSSGPSNGPTLLRKLDGYDRQVALASLRRDLDPDGPLFWSCDEHAAAYEGSDRARSFALVDARPLVAL